MERNIPHVLDVFTCSPGARRRALHTNDQVAVKVEHKNPGSDSAVSVDSSEDEGANISRYFDYLNDDDGDAGGGSASRRKKKKMQGKENQEKVSHQGKENQEEKKKKSQGKENHDKKETYQGKENQEDKTKTKDVMDRPSERSSRKEDFEKDFEKDIRHIERHLSMKKTIRKKMMRDLQQAFVEDPGEFQQDPNRMEPEKKNNINIRNLTISKGRLSKSEHNFLDMLKDENGKDNKKKGKGYREFMNNNKNKDNKVAVLNDDDSGNGSPTRESLGKAVSKDDLRAAKEAPKEEKKLGFWKKLTGKGKNKR
ncbi:hypothetical protein GWK47_042442 [Chionoecetes opilio]|uniref:Uncharacterized protein n=1 Tax=Chionoecetes opilio TaxID=41210 RepID=A0A8J4YH88_CHIOP|nr:hypothetical protein GWK47_042442 [Chionoecetes opilio]